MGARKLGIRGAPRLTRVNRSMRTHFWTNSPHKWANKRSETCSKGFHPPPSPNKVCYFSWESLETHLVETFSLFSFRAAGFGNYWAVTCQWLLLLVQSRELPITSGAVGWALQDLFQVSARISHLLSEIFLWYLDGFAHKALEQLAPFPNPCVG